MASSQPVSFKINKPAQSIIQKEAIITGIATCSILAIRCRLHCQDKTKEKLSSKRFSLYREKRNRLLLSLNL
jgi:hypothetical protein